MSLLKIFNSELIQWYPGLFDDINGVLFFHDDFKVIWNSSMFITQWSEYYDITPEIHPLSIFIFRLTMPLDMNDPDITRQLGVSNDIKLSDELCLKLFAYDINIIGYDREAITRRHTIENIINQ